ncbi:alpha/beta hydrolase [Gaetbulibacter aestuarii]|uniref:Alpha/beta hydrolase-fold protein n=1 Tax=Gaetbulibacter aestuarii TaxID=1502358 RepID=A0ABW7MVM8_9FLAO
MKKLPLCIVLLFISLQTLNAQAKYENFQSQKMGEERQLKILLPRNYEANSDKAYPLFVVLDGDYLFEAVSGNVDFLSYWEEMPEAIVVGINQYGKRYDDCMYSAQNGLPIESGANFFEFVGGELLTYLERNYRIGNFKVIVGQSDTANFINYFLLKPDPIFQGYIAMSPELAPQMIDYLPQRLGSVEKNTFYCLADTALDTKSIKDMVSALDSDIKAKENEKVQYNFNSFESPSHYALPAQALPKALEFMFKVFQPISKQEYQDKILKLEGSPVTYLKEKYQAIKDYYGIDKPILVNDFKAIAAAIEKNELFEAYEELGKMANKAYPDTLMGLYYIGRFYEETGEPKKAMRTFESAYALDEIGGITKDMAMDRADAIKADFGY